LDKTIFIVIEVCILRAASIQVFSAKDHRTIANFDKANCLKFQLLLMLIAGSSSINVSNHKNFLLGRFAHLVSEDLICLESMAATYIKLPTFLQSIVIRN
jgi:hypothetical protein